MPLINYNNLNDTEWIKNATYSLGIALHPLGEMSMLDYYMSDANPTEQARRFIGNAGPLVFYAPVAYLLVRNTIVSSKMMINRSHQLAPWCCLSSSVISTLAVIVIVLMVQGYANCRHAMWANLLVMSIASVSNSLILLQKAYLILFCKKWIIIASVLPMLIQSAHFAIFLSSIFCYIALQHHRQYKLDAWKQLARKGIQIMCLAALINIICSFLALTQAFGPMSDMLFPIDQMIVTTLMIYHCGGENPRESTPQSHLKADHLADSMEKQTV
ncbi:hypothetical protein BDF22DRAFT_694636 [Syncephalis plumigaleata]|nr:hypothetical protein BDF22DRAFT_694636 [Syncephalis plumigaleata]